MLEVKAVRKAFGALNAVDGLSFTASPGEIFGLIGPNGAGKSTTIRMIMGILAPDEGEVLLSGRRLGESSKARIGYLPEERGLYRKTKVIDMLRYLAALKGADHARAEAAIESWLGRFGLLDWRGRKIEELSKGMAQKVQFIGTVIHDPELLLFDEPFSGLDPVSQDILLESMLALRDAGKTLLFSTHVMEHAEKICSTILMVDRGRAVVSGSLGEIKAQHGRDAVKIECDGDSSFVRGLPFVEELQVWPRALQVRLRAGADPDELFRAIAGRLRVRRFETLEPSLHEIFIRLAGGDTAAAPASEGAAS